MISGAKMYNEDNGIGRRTKIGGKMVRKMASKGRLFDELPNGQWLFEEGFSEFLRQCKVKNLRPATLKDYEHCFKRFMKFRDEAYPEVKYCGEIKLSIIQDYILDLREAGMKDTSVNTYLRNIKTYLNYLFDLEAATRFKIPVVKSDRKIKETYTEDELSKLLVRPNMKTCSFSTYRNWVIINFLLSTGVRAQTLIETKIIDVDTESLRLELRYNKSRKSYTVPMSQKLAEVLVDYLNIRNGDELDYLFSDAEGNGMTYEGLKTAIQRYNIERGVTKTSLHLFRHTFAKICVRNGMDPFRLQKYLGHSDLTVSRQYVEMFADDLAEGFDAINPLDNFDFTKGQKKKPGKIKMKR